MSLDKKIKFLLATVKMHTKRVSSFFRQPSETRKVKWSKQSAAELAAKLKYLPHLLPKRELLLFRIFFVLFVVSLLWLLVGVWLSITDAVPKQGGSYTEGVVGRPRLINPLYAETNSVDRDLVRLTYAALLRFDGHDLQPDLTEQWEVSPDLLQYTFYLRRDIDWPDGEHFDAADVLFTFTAIKDANYQSPLRTTFAGIKVEALDDYAVRFTLPEPFTPFLESLTVGILPEHIWRHVLPENLLLTDFNTRPLGLGPYQFEQLTKDKFGAIRSYTVVANNDYHLPGPLIKRITFRFYQSQEEAMSALRSREVEGLSFVSLGSLADLRINNIALHSLQLPQYTAVFFNLSADTPVSDKQVRLALAHALDKQVILNKAIKGEGQVVEGPILPGFPGYNPDIERFSYDSTRADELLSAAGWTKKQGEYFDEDDEKLTLTLTTANDPELIKTAELIQGFWTDLGIAVELKIVDVATINKTVISPRNFEALLFGEIVGLDPDPYAFWHSSQISSTGLNLSNFRHAQVDAVLAEARQTADIKKKADKYVHFQNILVAEMPAIFLYNPNYIYPVTDKIMGLSQTKIIVSTDRLANINQWFIRTKRVFK